MTEVIEDLNIHMRVSDGHVILGQEGPEAEVYITHYRIEHVRQRSALCRQVCHGECVPCCSPANSATWGTTLAAAVRSEILLFPLHMFTIVIGVLKGQVSICTIAAFLLVVCQVLIVVVSHVL